MTQNSKLKIGKADKLKIQNSKLKIQNSIWTILSSSFRLAA